MDHQSPAKTKAHGKVAGVRIHGENLGGGSRGMSSCDDTGINDDPDAEPGRL